MSRYDRTKKRRDKIVQFIKEYGALSTKNAHKLLTENGFAVNHRTVQRDFEELQVQKIIKPNLPVGREQTYSLVEEEKKDKKQKPSTEKPSKLNPKVEAALAYFSWRAKQHGNRFYKHLVEYEKAECWFINCFCHFW